MIIERYAVINHVQLDEVLSEFYHSDLYSLIHDGISNMYCKSDEYLAEEINSNKL